MQDPRRRPRWPRIWRFISDADTMASVWGYIRPLVWPAVIGAATALWAALSQLPTVLVVVLFGLATAVAFVIFNAVQEHKVRRQLVADKAPVSSGAVIRDTVEAEIAKPVRLAEQEMELAKNAMGMVRRHIDTQLAQLHHDSLWLGGAPQKLMPRVNEIPELRDRSRRLKGETQGVLDQCDYGLKLVRLDLHYLVLAVTALGNGTHKIWSNLAPLVGMADERHHGMINEFKEPAVRANGEFGNAIERARHEINTARMRSDG